MAEQLKTEYVHIIFCHVLVDWETAIGEDGYTHIVPKYRCRQPAVADSGYGGDLLYWCEDHRHMSEHAPYPGDRARDIELTKVVRL